MALDATGPPERARRWAGMALLLAPVVGLACVPVYAHEEPRLFDVPFFYWYQLAWVPLSIVCMAAAALLMPMSPTRPTHHRTAEPGGPL